MNCVHTMILLKSDEGFCVHARVCVCVLHISANIPMRISKNESVSGPVCWQTDKKRTIKKQQQQWTNNTKRICFVCAFCIRMECTHFYIQYIQCTHTHTQTHCKHPQTRSININIALLFLSFILKFRFLSSIQNGFSDKYDILLQWQNCI